jgi:hypothetical protein
VLEMRILRSAVSSKENAKACAASKVLVRKGSLRPRLPFAPSRLQPQSDTQARLNSHSNVARHEPVQRNMSKLMAPERAQYGRTDAFLTVAQLFEAQFLFAML